MPRPSRSSSWTLSTTCNGGGSGVKATREHEKRRGEEPGGRGYLLGGHHVPNSVARQDDKLIVRLAQQRLYLGEGRHCLPLRGQALILVLWIKVSDGAPVSHECF